MMQAEEEQRIEQILDRRLGDFEKIVDTRLKSIHDAVSTMQEGISTYISRVSNFHIEYVPRSEIQREQERTNREIEGLKKDVKRLEAWRNYLAGAIAILGFVVGVVIQHYT